MRSQSGDKKALRVLVEKNQGLVHKLVHKFPLKNAQVTYDDLWQEGCIGFMHAIEMFEVDKGYRLSTYSYRWIYAYIRRYYQNQGRVVRIPVHLADNKFKLDRKVEELSHRLGYVPTMEQLDVLVPGYSEIVKTFGSIISLNQELESGEEVLDLQVCPQNDSSALEVDFLLDILKENVSNRDYEIFISRYGVDGQTEHTLSEVAEIYGITRSRCHQVTNKCVNIIKECVND